MIGRKNRRDQADISDLIKIGNVDITPFSKWLKPEEIQLFKEINDNPN